MLIKCLILSCLLNFPLVVSGQERLASLTDSQLAADNFKQYSPSVRERFPDMHRNGDKWSDEQLQEIFKGGIFQQYFNELTRIDLNLDYNKLTPMNISMDQRVLIFHVLNTVGLKMPSPTAIKKNPEEFKRILDIIEWYKEVGNSLKENSTFKKLGGDFQRKKIIVEKLQAALKSFSGNKEQLFQNMMTEDRIAMDMQTALFYWMNDVFDQAKTILKEGYKDNQLPTSAKEFIETAKTYAPDFMTWPVYRNLILK